MAALFIWTEPVGSPVAAEELINILPAFSRLNEKVDKTLIRRDAGGWAASPGGRP